jgi:glucose/mannose-6-phosphate isomerase
LLTIENLRKIDAEFMYETYDKWPTIARENYNTEFPKINLENIEHVVFAGMGGSGAIGDIFSSIFSKMDTHVTVVKGYLLPKTVNEKTLVVCTSISGNTQETLSILENSKKLNAQFVSFSSGGVMEKYCKNNNIKHYNIKKEHSPRASFLGFLYSTLNVLEEIIPINKNDINESINSLNQIKKKIDSNNLNKSNEALELANWIKNIPIIYYPWGLHSAAIRFKNSMQENAKKHVLFEDVIETCHNGIVSWESLSNVQPILMQGKDDHFKTRERWKIVKEFFQDKEIEYKEIFSVEGSILSKLVCLIYSLDMTSIYNAVISGINPSPVNSIEFIKKRL